MRRFILSLLTFVVMPACNDYTHEIPENNGMNEYAITSQSPASVFDAHGCENTERDGEAFTIVIEIASIQEFEDPPVGYELVF